MNDNDRLTHFGKQEYDLLRQQSQQPNFFRTLATLTDKEQKLIKTLFKQLNTVPAQTKFGIKNLRPPKKQKELFPEPEPEKEKEETPPERSWSVYAPKTIRAADKLFKNNEDINSIQKVYKLANNFGITGKELRDYYLMEYHNQQTKYYHEDQAAYLHKWLRDKMGKNNRWNSPAIQEGDHASKAFSWDTLMRTLNSSGIDHPLVHAARNSSYADQSNYAHNNEASERLWYFYLAGPPEQTPIVTRLFQALQEIVYPHYEQGQGYQRKKAVGYTFPIPNEDDLPF
jgi:hypothetical protein